MTTTIAPPQLTLPYRTVEEAREEIDLMDSPHELRSLLDATRQEGHMVSLAIQYHQLMLNPVAAWLQNRRARKRLRLISSICNAIADRADLLAVEPPLPNTTP